MTTLRAQWSVLKKAFPASVFVRLQSQTAHLAHLKPSSNGAFQMCVAGASDSERAEQELQMVAAQPAGFCPCGPLKCVKPADSEAPRKRNIYVAWIRAIFRTYKMLLCNRYAPYCFLCTTGLGEKSYAKTEQHGRAFGFIWSSQLLSLRMWKLTGAFGLIFVELTPHFPMPRFAKHYSNCTCSLMWELLGLRLADDAQSIDFQSAVL